MLKAGKKTREWRKAKKKLIKEYQLKEIRFCEVCGSNFGLAFHHLKRRSRGGQHTFDNTVLLCAECHQKADHGPKEFNHKLHQLR